MSSPVCLPFTFTVRLSFFLEASRAFCAMNRETSQGSIYVAELETGGTRLKDPQRLTLDENSNLLSSWTPDGKAVLFSSNRNGQWDIYKQNITERVAEPILTGGGDKGPLGYSADGEWIFYSGPGDKLFRLPVSGGPPQFVRNINRGFAFPG